MNKEITAFLYTPGRKTISCFVRLCFLAFVVSLHIFVLIEIVSFFLVKIVKIIWFGLDSYLVYASQIYSNW